MSEIELLEKNSNEHNINVLNEKNDILQSIRKSKLNGNFIRSRAKWITQGENQYHISAV